MKDCVGKIAYAILYNDISLSLSLSLRPIAAGEPMGTKEPTSPGVCFCWDRKVGSSTQDAHNKSDMLRTN